MPALPFLPEASPPRAAEYEHSMQTGVEDDAGVGAL